MNTPETRANEYHQAMAKAANITSDPVTQANIASVDLLFSRLFGRDTVEICDEGAI